MGRRPGGCGVTAARYEQVSAVCRLQTPCDAGPRLDRQSPEQALNNPESNIFKLSRVNSNTPCMWMGNMKDCRHMCTGSVRLLKLQCL